jgi:hypothetical protein
LNAKEQRNRQFLRDLFAGPFRGHAIIMDHEAIPAPYPGDYAVSDRPLQEWLPYILRNYEAQVCLLDAIDHDAVPHVRLTTGTGIFAAAFGCAIHIYPDSPAAARPLVFTAEEADRLAVPSLDAPTIARVFEMGEMARQRIGPGVPINVPDIQSAFDIAALIWNKEDFYIAILQNPKAVCRLVDKCQALLKSFFGEFMRCFPECNLCHCPNAWAPPELGVWLSEDESGAMSVTMFEEFCLPNLNDLSDTYGGLFVHCCATADHQYCNFKKIHNLRALNRVFQSPGPRAAIQAFSGQSVLMQAWTNEEDINKMLDMALPDTRFLLNMPAQPLDEARHTYERLRKRCPRVDG